MSDPTIDLDGVEVSHKDIEIARDGDLTVRVIEYEEIDSDGNMEPAFATDFCVQKEILKKRSPVFASMLGPHWREGKQKLIELHEDTGISTTAIHVWLRIFHGDGDSKETCGKVNHEHLWHVYEAAQKYRLEIDDAKAWFDLWWNAHELEVDCRIANQLLFPCWAFRHLRAFGYVTKIVVYNEAGYISPVNPTPHKDLQLPDKIPQQLNKAKLKLKDTVQKMLWEPMAEFLQKERSGSEDKRFVQHQRRLVRKNIWPSEKARVDNGIEHLLERIESLKVDRAEENSDLHEYTQGDHLDASLGLAVEKTRTQFDGLCLKCMAMSESGRGKSDEAYFAKNRRKDWDDECRDEGMDHGDDSWFFSYLGRRPFTERREYWWDSWNDDRWW
ncbi:uncharacterized protein J3D65DRAFT_694829 [Phyllosticta citribraziliensis]|uniref:BTB domain-containing protein n=1 Tax=Phyllosticta citribraziliensis TaxID=989973 RepID=A0ABR1LTI6_9PEZI